MVSARLWTPKVLSLEETMSSPVSRARKNEVGTPGPDWGSDHDGAGGSGDESLRGGEGENSGTTGRILKASRLAEYSI